MAIRRARSGRSESPSTHWWAHIPSVLNANSVRRRFQCNRANVDLVRFSRWQTEGCVRTNKMDQSITMTAVRNVLQWRIGDAQVIRLYVRFQSVQFFMQNVEAEKAHLRDCNSLFNLIAIRVGLAVGVGLLVLVRWVTILVRKEVSTCHLLRRDWHFLCFKLRRRKTSIQDFLHRSRNFQTKPKWISNKHKNIEQNSINVTLEFHQNDFYTRI